jgi:hypothetical protein
MKCGVFDVDADIKSGTLEAILSSRMDGVMIRRTLRTIGWVAGGLVALAVVLYLIGVVVNWRDAEPSAAATRFANRYRDRPTVADQDNGFVALASFETLTIDPEQRDPGLRQFIRDCTPASSAGCPTAFESADAVFDRWTSAEPELLDRYQQLIAHAGWREAVPVDLAAPLPSYARVMDGQRLLLLKANKLAGSGDYAGAQALLADDIRFWRMALGSSDILISKMIATAALYRHFEVGNEIVRRLPPARAPDILPASWQTPLSNAERSMNRCLTGEWIFTSGVLRTVNSYELTRAESSAPVVEMSLLDRAKERLFAPFYQPQDTINRYAESYEEIGTLLNVPLEQYETLKERSSAHADKLRGAAWPLRSLYNLAGRFVAAAFSSDFASYAVRVGDIEGVRRAALAAVTLRAANVPASGVPTALSSAQLRNPYNDRPFSWDEKDGAIVFRGLQPGERGEHRIRY